ncbi:MAG: Ig-like domain-containing protein [Bacteroidales bacterium]|nr:Ig-like domain-containing protein [Bacteroidales bacterium]
MKKFLYSAMVLSLAFAIIFISCDKDPNDNTETTPVSVTNVTLNQTTVTLGVGDTLTLIATVLPDSATNKTVSWSSSAPAIVSVVNGKLTALTDGTATITVTTQDGSKTDTCAVTVVAPVFVTGVTLNRTTATLSVDSTLTLIPTVLPADATNKAVTWQSSNTAIATVNNGTVTAIAVGTATITVTTQDGSKTDTCAVTVRSGGELSDAELTAINCDTTVNSGTFGTVTWGGNVNIETQVWNISGNGITQTWSDAVQVSNCDEDKPTFHPTFSTAQPYHVDCRNATNGFHGHYFSWCFVKRYEALLCPGDWRVPTQQDFIDLDIALGGTDDYHTDATVLAEYAGTSGSGTSAVNRAGTWGGSRFTAHASAPSAVTSRYWSSSENSESRAFHLFYDVSLVYPQRINDTKGYGHALRCVRDN